MSVICAQRSETSDLCAGAAAWALAQPPAKKGKLHSLLPGGQKGKKEHTLSIRDQGTTMIRGKDQVGWVPEAAAGGGGGMRTRMSTASPGRATCASAHAAAARGTSLAAARAATTTAARVGSPAAIPRAQPSSFRRRVPLAGVLLFWQRAVRIWIFEVGEGNRDEKTVSE